MSPLAAAATATNLLLATGPFTYPEGFCNLGPVTSGLMLAVTCFVAYISATFMIEAISVAVAKKKLEEEAEPTNEEAFNPEQYKSPIVPRKTFLKDLHDKDSAFYIRQKIEMSLVGETLASKTCKNLIIFILTIYVYGAVCLKYVGGAESFVDGVSYTIWGN